LFAAVRHPGCFVNIKARLTHKKYSVGALGKKLQRDATSMRHISTISTKPSKLWRSKPSFRLSRKPIFRSSGMSTRKSDYEQQSVRSDEAKQIASNEAGRRDNPTRLEVDK